MTARRDLVDDPWERRLPVDEFDRRLEAALASARGPEGDEMRELIDWFLRKYPTPLARLAYARRKYREAIRLRGVARDKAG